MSSPSSALPPSGVGPESSDSIEHIRPFRASSLLIPPEAARVEGQLPKWLRGELLRTCPGVFQLKDWSARHWFDGLGLVFGFKFSDAGVSLRCRQLDTEAARAAAEGLVPLTAFDTPMKRPLWKRIVEPAGRPTDNTNVNIVKYGEEWVALTESAYPVIVDPQDLSTKGHLKFADKLSKRAIMSAHPQYDFGRDKVVNALVYLGAVSYVAFYEHAGPSRLRQEITRLTFNRVPYIHSFGMTPHHLIIVAHPFRVLAPLLLWSNKGFIEGFKWYEQEATDVHVFDRRTNKWQVYQTDPMFVFHMAHAFERQGELVLDLVAHRDTAFISQYRTAALCREQPDLRAQLLRLRLQSGRREAVKEVLSSHEMEFPAVSYRRVQGKAAQFIWGSSVGPQQGTYGSTLLATDTLSGDTKSYSEPHMIYGEPVFVGAPGRQGENEGVLLVVGNHLHKDLCSCLVLDAQTFQVLARAEIDYAMPLGFHGSFFADAKT